MLPNIGGLLMYRRRLTRIGGANSWLSGIGKDPLGPSQLLTRPAGESHRSVSHQLQELVTGSALHHHPQGWHDGPRYVQAVHLNGEPWKRLNLG